MQAKVIFENKPDMNIYQVVSESLEALFCLFGVSKNRDEHSLQFKATLCTTIQTSFEGYFETALAKVYGFSLCLLTFFIQNSRI